MRFRPQRLFLAIVVFLGYGLGLADVGFEDAQIDWRQFEGESIDVFFARHPWQEAIEPLIPEFEALTGMRVRVVRLPENEYKTRVPADLTANTFRFDVFMTEYYDAPMYQAENWTADLAPFLADPALTDANWYAFEDDFFPGAQDIATIGGFYFDRIPITSEAQVLVYRTDVLDQLGLDVPTNFDELLSVAEAVVENTQIAGITLRGGPAIWWPLYGVMRSFGGEYVSVDGDVVTPVLDTPEGVAALDMYARLARLAPAGVTNFDWDEINSAMLTGQAAMFLDSSVIFPRLQDPSVSTVVGTIGIAPFPTGPVGRHGHSHYWTISIAESSARKEQGWLFLQWATSPPVMEQLSLAGILAPRASAWDVDGFEEVFPDEFIEAVRTSLASAVISPANLRFFELMDPLRAEAQNVILERRDPAAALSAVQAEWERIVGR